MENSDAQDQSVRRCRRCFDPGRIGGWASSTVNAGRTAAVIPINAQRDPFQEMVKAKGLPTSHYDDYSLIFN